MKGIGRVIFVAGLPAAGKTTYAVHLAKNVGIPLLSKDAMKEHLHDALHYDPVDQETSHRYGAAAYEVFYYAARQVMCCRYPLILESNFPPQAAEVLRPMLSQYGYQPLTLLFDADLNVLHKRFVERDHTPERHAGLVLKSGIYEDFAVFSKAVLPLRDFSVGGVQKKVDTTNFENVDYPALDQLVEHFLRTTG